MASERPAPIFVCGLYLPLDLGDKAFCVCLRCKYASIGKAMTITRHKNFRFMIVQRDQVRGLGKLITIVMCLKVICMIGNTMHMNILPAMA